MQAEIDARIEVIIDTARFVREARSAFGFLRRPGARSSNTPARRRRRHILRAPPCSGQSTKGRRPDAGRRMCDCCRLTRVERSWNCLRF
jgi:hypothetical protein